MRTRQKILGLIALGFLAACGTAAVATDDPLDVNPDANQVSYWCPQGGVKYDPATTPFVVPAPPEGKVWTLLVLKAGSEQSADPVNEQFPNPVVGQAYSRTDGKGISHAILCYQPTPPPPTTTTTTLPPPTTPPPTTTTTTVPASTTTTVPGSTTTTTQPAATTTTTVPAVTTTTVRPVTPPPPPPAVPVTIPATL